MLFLLSTADHSFFGSEWQKRWCVLNNSTLYYFGSEKGLSSPVNVDPDPRHYDP